MLWVIQNNIFNEAGYHDLINTLITEKIPHLNVKVIPFSDELDPKPEIVNPIAVMGSYTLVKIAKKYGWGPGVFANENFDFNIWKHKYRNHVLNDDGQVIPFGEIILHEPMFIRPCDDTKDFVGQVITPDSFNEWKSLITDYNGYTVTPKTMVCVATPKDIIAEYRFFVVDGKVITGSRYRLNGRTSQDSNVEPDIENFAQDMVNIWQPDRGFVIDIAVTENGYRVIEINCLNASGFYKCDVGKIIRTINVMNVP
jgi:hypothetical protein